MPDALNALVAFVAEHQRCGDLDGGTDNGFVWDTVLVWWVHHAPDR
jgi:hypothetical protein